MQMNKLMGSLTLPVVAPLLPDVECVCCNSAGQLVVRPLAHDREAAQQALEGDEGELATGGTLLGPRQWISGQPVCEEEQWYPG